MKISGVGSVHRLMTSLHSGVRVIIAVSRTIISELAGIFQIVIITIIVVLAIVS